jgi:hypothetical protein
MEAEYQQKWFQLHFCGGGSRPRDGWVASRVVLVRCVVCRAEDLSNAKQELMVDHTCDLLKTSRALMALHACRLLVARSGLDGGPHSSSTGSSQCSGSTILHGCHMIYSASVNQHRQCTHVKPNSNKDGGNV